MSQAVEPCVFSPYPDSSRNALHVALAAARTPTDSPPPGRVGESARARAQNVQNTVARITALNEVGSLESMIEIGRILFEDVFNSDTRALRSRGRKGLSFRSLAGHPGLKLSAATLWRAVAIYELWQQIPEVSRFRHLGIGHLSSVIGLPVSAQRALLSAGETQRWTRRRLQAEAASFRTGSPRGRGTGARLIKSLRAQLESLPDASASEDLKNLTLDEAELIRDLIRRMEDQLVELVESLPPRG